MLRSYSFPSAMALPKPSKSASLSSSKSHTFFFLPNPCSSTTQPRRSSERGCSRTTSTSASTSSSNNNNIRAEAAVASRSTTTTTNGSAATVLKAVVTVKPTGGGILSIFSLTTLHDFIADILGKSLLLELVSAELDPETGLERRSIEAFARQVKKDGDEVKYEADFKIRTDFGEVGGVLVRNEHNKEMYFIDIVLTGYGDGPITFMCNSWVHAKSDSSSKRIFFTNKSYLPSQTPSGLKQLRSEELENLRGNGQGERKTFERIYDYDTYNDLGDPDSDDLARPVLGGKDHPYPRRCRTGGPRSEKDPLSETRSSTMYVPRDEAFSPVKQLTFNLKTISSILPAVIPSLQTILVDSKLGFRSFKEIDSLYDKGIDLPKPKVPGGIFKLQLPRLIKAIADTGDQLLLFESPEMIEMDKFSWLKDEEFARQTLAGVNPMSIELVKEFPFVSKLDPKIYGPPESEISKELVEREIKACMTLEEAIKQKKLFVLDYHDLLLPFVHKVRELEGTTLYGSRTLFFLTEENTLKPIAIELTRPASSTKPQWKRVFTPSSNATNSWLWKLAKVHVCAHDSGYHELVIHWLRTHASVEPYIIATHRQLSVMHPIFRLLHPHLRYSMAINVLAREALINAGGIIESSFSPLKYSMEISSVAYDKLWRFDMQALPADLINRGMAVEDPTAEHGVRLTIEDYPFAIDGLLIWSATKQWVSDYVNHYYQDNDMVSSDAELQEWWTEVRTRGHEDKKDEPWWPTLKTRDDLIQVLTNIIWVASAHHAAVNFGQYTFGGYFPNRPSIARTNLPVEDESGEDFERFMKKPDAAMLQCFPTPVQATIVMAILDVLSNHSPDEEYLGDLPESAWSESPVIKDAFERFHGRLQEIERIIDARNADKNLRNRVGAGIVPYQLLKPFSGPGVTGKGIPNSVSI